MNTNQTNNDQTNNDQTKRCAVVTGGLTGIGLAIAKALLATGTDVIVGSRSASEAQSYHESGNLYSAILDVSDSDSVNQFVEFALSKSPQGSIDILVNAAGISTSQTVCEHDEAMWSSIINTNLTGAFRMTKALLPGMIKRNWGRVINIGSTAATVGEINSPAYCASKAGLLGLTRCVALEGAAHGVTCTMVSPTWVDTPMMRRSMARQVESDDTLTSVEEAMQRVANENPQQRVVQSDEIAALVRYLCSEDAKGLTMENIQVTGGAQW